MAENVKQSPSLATPGSQAMAGSRPIPRFIQSQLDHPPIGRNEDAAEFRSLFHELAESAQGGQRTAAEYAMLLQVTGLTFRAVGLERIRAALISHRRPEAVLGLLRRTHPHGDVAKSSLAYFDANAQRIDYFASKEGRKQVEAQFAGAGYGPDAVELEAFELALASLASIDRQINAAQKQLMAFLKEVDLRDFRRSEELRKASLSAVSRARSETDSKRGAN